MNIPHFCPARPVSAELFVGRDALVTTLADAVWHGPGTSFTGGPGMGKTSLLHAIERRLLQIDGDTRPTPVYFDCSRHAAADGAALARELLAATAAALERHHGVVLPRSDLEAILAANYRVGLERLLACTVSHAPRRYRPALLLDNLHRVQAVAPELLAILAPAVERLHVTILLSSKRPLPDELRDDVSNLRHLIVDHKTLGPLKRDDLKELLRRAWERGSPVDLRCVRTLFDLTGGHPFRVHHYLAAAARTFNHVTVASLRRIRDDPDTERYLEIILHAGDAANAAAGPTLQDCYQELRDAFDRPGLMRIVRFGLDQRLDDIVGDRGLEDVTFALVDWADRRRLLGRLLDAAARDRPLRATLRQLADAYALAMTPR